MLITCSVRSLKLLVQEVQPIPCSTYPLKLGGRVGAVTISQEACVAIVKLPEIVPVTHVVSNPGQSPASW